MQEDNAAQAADSDHAKENGEKGPRVVVAVFATAVILFLTLAWNAVSYRLHGSLNPCFFLLSLFLSINLPICYWEACLYLRRDYIVGY